MKPNSVFWTSGGAFSGILRRHLRRALRGRLQRAPLGRRFLFLARFARLTLVDKLPKVSSLAGESSQLTALYCNQVICTIINIPIL